MDKEGAPLTRARFLAQEIRAVARFVSLLPRDTRVILPPRPARGGDAAVLVHGLFSTPGVLRPIREYLERSLAISVACFAYLSGPGVAELGLRLGEFIRRLPSNARVHVIGHSFGGVVVRWYSLEGGGDPRLVQTISIASPFSGIPAAAVVPAPALRDIDPGSPLLQRLRTLGLEGEGVPHVSILASRDALVQTNTGATGSEVVVLDEVGHHGILYHPRLFAELARRIPRACPSSPAA